MVTRSRGQNTAGSYAPFSSAYPPVSGAVNPALGTVQKPRSRIGQGVSAYSPEAQGLHPGVLPLWK